MTPRRILPRGTVALFGTLLLALPLTLAAQSTPYVPNLDPAYQDLDALVADGLVPGAIHAERPVSRLTLARWIVEARTRAKAASAPLPARFREALDRLETRFAPEIRTLCPDGRSACSAVPTRAVLRTASTDATWSNSPPRAVPTPYGDGTSYIDAALNPLLQDNQGRRLADGETLGAEASMDVVFGRHFSGEIYPRVWASHVAAGPDTGTTGGVTLEDGYLRGVFGNLAVDLGRNQVEQGQGREGGPVLSYNPRGLDLVRLSLDRPARLPGFLRGLGPVEGSALVADLGRGSATPHSKLIVFDGSIHPHPNLELGLTLENHQGGQNAPTATFKQRLEDILLIFPRRPDRRAGAWRDAGCGLDGPREPSDGGRHLGALLRRSLHRREPRPDVGPHDQRPRRDPPTPHRRLDERPGRGPAHVHPCARGRRARAAVRFRARPQPRRRDGAGAGGVEVVSAR